MKLAAKAFVEGKPSGHLGDALRKAARIMSGELPEHVLPTGIKAGNFYRCITDPIDADSICIDRHALDMDPLNPCPNNATQEI
ncbi:hypothetical protein SAMN05216276_1008168 [Streptosporangium subroseum]|uniref:Uncharacterized protein n=1 Tax=Streptosporangium subroseum TaxID=106412 RepID=A0A239E2Q4_9ACTN|nr:hypothetical protein SAMN05216276_1008168 [Streptosporangium subroseum]